MALDTVLTYKCITVKSVRDNVKHLGASFIKKYYMKITYRNYCRQGPSNIY